MRLEVVAMKSYHGLPYYNGDVSVLVTAPAGNYWLERRQDLLDWEGARLTAPDELSGSLWLLAVDLLADVVGDEEVVLRAAPDLVPVLHKTGIGGDWVMFEEHVERWFMQWVCRQLGLLPPEKEVTRA
jgi:hypothetical protein